MAEENDGAFRDRVSWRTYSRTQLDAQYNARATVPDARIYIERYASLSASVRAHVPYIGGLAYGTHPREVLDFFPAGAGAPILAFIHGGYWRALSKDDSSFPAEVFTRAGVAFSAIDYALAPEVSIDDIVDQVRRALAWLHTNANDLGADPDRLFVAGSSAGGHLVGMLLAAGWHRQHGVPHEVVKGAVPVSGLFDLEPLLSTHVNDWARLDLAAARRNSPLHHLPTVGCRLVVACGANETAEFKRQSTAFAAKWAARGFACRDLGAIPGRNHFDVILDLADPGSMLTRAILDLIQP